MRYFFVLVMFLLIFVQVGCARFLKPEKLPIEIQAAKHLNPNIDEQSSPVVLVLYQLQSPLLFRHSSFSSLYTRPFKVLGNTLISKDEIEIRPKQKLQLVKPIAPQTKYIGVIAAFRNPAKSRWRQIVPIAPGVGEKLVINLGTQTVALHYVAQ